MSRDIRFEVNYLLTLTVAVLGFLSIEGIKNYFDEKLGYLFILFVSLHLLFFNIYYTFNKTTEYTFAYSGQLRDGTKFTFYSMSVLFSYLIAHILATFLYISMDMCASPSASLDFLLLQINCVPAQLLGLGLNPARIFISYGLPLLAVVVFAFPLMATIPSLRFFNDIEIIISPPEIEITPIYEENFDLSITFLKDSDNSEDFSIEVLPPDNVLLKHEDEEVRALSIDNITLPPGESGDKISLQLRYEGNERRDENIDVKIKHRLTTKTKQVKAKLYP